MKIDHELIITDWLAEELFWPHKEPFFSMKDVEDGFRIPISKMGSVIKLFDKYLKKSLEE